MLKKILIFAALLPLLAASGGGQNVMTGNSRHAASSGGTASAPTFSPISPYTGSATTVTASTSTSGCGSYIYFDTSNPPTTNQTTYSYTTPIILYAYVHGCPGYGDSSVATWTGASLLFYGIGCNGTSTNTCTIGGSSQNSFYSSGTSIGYPFTTGSHAGGYTVVGAGGYYLTAAGNTTFAIYGGTLGSATLVCSTTAGVAEGSSAAWTENDNFSGCTLAASTTYWVMNQVSSDSSAIGYAAGSSGIYTFSVPYGTWPSPHALSSGGYNYSVYVKLQTN